MDVTTDDTKLREFSFVWVELICARLLVQRINAMTNGFIFVIKTNLPIVLLLGITLAGCKGNRKIEKWK
jgi:hypothetical protein